MLYVTSDIMSLFVLTIIGLIFAGSVNTEQVKNIVMKPGSKCQVYDVVIDPCPEALQNKICELPQGSNSSINFKYIPGFSSRSPGVRMYAVTAFLDMPFMDMDPNACLYTKCPMEAGAESSWSYQLFISEMYPKSQYVVKFKYWGDDKQNDVCAFTFGLKIV